MAKSNLSYLAVVFLFDVGEQCGVAVVSLAAGAEELARLVGLVGGLHGNIIWIFINSKYINNYMLNYQKTRMGRFASLARAHRGAGPTSPEGIFGRQGFALEGGGSCPEWAAWRWIVLFAVI